MLRCLLLIFAPPICTKLQCTAWPVTSQTVLHRWSRPTKHQHDWQAFHRAQLWAIKTTDLQLEILMPQFLKVCLVILVPVWFTVHLPYICIPCTWYFFTMIAFASFCSLFGLLPLAFNIFNGHHQMSTVWNDFGYLWIKSWHRRLFDAETKTRASRAALLTRGILASQLGSDQKWHRRTKGIKKTVKTLYLLDHISIL